MSQESIDIKRLNSCQYIVDLIKQDGNLVKYKVVKK